MTLKPLEFHSRSIVKSVSYRVVMIMVDYIAAYFFTRDIKLSIGIVIFVETYSTILYYLHERVWAHIHWGHQSAITPVQK